MNWIASHSDALMVIVTCVYVFFTLLLVIPTFKSNQLLQKSLEQNEKSELARTRPYLSLEILFDYPTKKDDLPVCYLLLKNTGLTQAYEIKVSSDKRIFKRVLLGGTKEVQITPYFIDNDIKTLAPNCTLSDGLGFTAEIYNEFEQPVFNCKISYKDKYNNYFEDSTTLDFEIMRHATPYTKSQILINNHIDIPSTPSKNLALSKTRKKLVDIIKSSLYKN